MWGLVWARLRVDWRRSLATFLAVLFAVTSFVVLTGATAAMRVDALDLAADAWRSSVDVLVRPANSRSGIELETGMVRPNFLQDIYGGISVEQWEQIANLPGVEVAAPIAMVGVVWAPVMVPVDLSDFVAPSGEQLLRLNLQTHSRGEVLPSRGAYLYVTDNPLEPAMEAVWTQWAVGLAESTGPVEMIAGEPTFPCIALQRVQIPASNALEWPAFSDYPQEPFDPAAWDSFCVSRADLEVNSYVLELPLIIPLTVAAIDPRAEAELVGLDNAVVRGRFFSGNDELTVNWVTELIGSEYDFPIPTATALISSVMPAADLLLVGTVEELSSDTIAELRSFDPSVVRQARRTDQLEIVVAAAAVAQLGEVEIPVTDIYMSMLAGIVPDTPGYLQACDLWRPGPVSFAESTVDGIATGEIRAFTSAPQGLRQLFQVLGSGCDPGNGLRPIPGTVAATTWYRRLDRNIISHTDATRTWTNFAFDVVGVFDPFATMAPVGGGGVLLPMETYVTPPVSFTDPELVAAAGTEVFRPNLNPADYLLPDIAMVIPLDQIELATSKWFPNLRDHSSIHSLAPVSAIRVRVAGVTGWDEISQLRVATVANAIVEATGLDVDTTIGAGLSPQQVTLTRTAGPDVQISEYWTQLGVVLNVVAQVDRKSVLLFSLILASGGLTIAAVGSAAAAAQRRDLGTMAAVGNRPTRLWGYLLSQQGLLGLAAGILGAVLAVPIAAALQVHINPYQALAAIPTAVTVVLLASIPSAIAAARTTPTALLAPPVRAGKRAFRVTNAVTFGIASITRRPLRLLRAAAAIAVAVIALSVLLVIMWTFQGAVAGTILGQAMVMQVRTADIIAAIILTMLGLVCLTMTLRFAHLEDRSDWATLAAIGWTPARVTGAVIAQSAAVAIIGVTIGGLAAYGITSALIGAASTTYLTPIALVAATIATAATLTGLIPATMLKHLPTAHTLTNQ